MRRHPGAAGNDVFLQEGEEDAVPVQSFGLVHSDDGDLAGTVEAGFGIFRFHRFEALGADDVSQQQQGLAHGELVGALAGDAVGQLVGGGQFGGVVTQGQGEEGNQAIERQLQAGAQQAGAEAAGPLYGVGLGRIQGARVEKLFRQTGQGVEVLGGDDLPFHQYGEGGFEVVGGVRPIEELYQGQKFGGDVGVAILLADFVQLDIAIAQPIRQRFRHKTPLTVLPHQDGGRCLGVLGVDLD